MTDRRRQPSSVDWELIGGGLIAAVAMVAFVVLVLALSDTL